MTQKAILWQNVSVFPVRPDPRVQMRGIKLFQTKRRKIVSGKSGQSQEEKRGKRRWRIPSPVPGDVRVKCAAGGFSLIGNVRCFAEEQRVPIRPNHLVGWAKTARERRLFWEGIGLFTFFIASPFLKNDANSAPPPKFIASFNDEPFCIWGLFGISCGHADPASASCFPSFQLGGKNPFLGYGA